MSNHTGTIVSFLLLDGVQANIVRSAGRPLEAQVGLPGLSAIQAGPQHSVWTSEMLG